MFNVTCVCLFIGVSSNLGRESIVCVRFYVSWSNPVMTMATRSVLVAMLTGGVLAQLTLISPSHLSSEERQSASWTCQLNFLIGSTFSTSLKVNSEYSCMDLSVAATFVNNIYIWSTIQKCFVKFKSASKCSSWVYTCAHIDYLFANWKLKLALCKGGLNGYPWQRTMNVESVILWLR